MLQPIISETTLERKTHCSCQLFSAFVTLAGYWNPERKFTFTNVFLFLEQQEVT